MLVFRITLAKWAKQLQGSGYPARWNAKGKFVIYTAGSRALATLENLVHRSGEGLLQSFKLISIEIPKAIKIETIDETKLPGDWYKTKNYAACQQIGDNWINGNSTTILKVPSAIITEEFNYIINPNHAQFKKVKIVEVNDFRFDDRLVSI